MIEHSSLNRRQLYLLLRNKRIAVAGNQHLKIYGTMQCASGKKMKKGNRVFFNSEEEAVNLGYRPCGHCSRAKYNTWKHGLI
jgi:methylphosphotriester-DNA--protein-cysteine methyltransferase